MFRIIWSWLVYTGGGLHRYFGNLNDMRSEHERAVHYFARAYAIDPRFWQARQARAVLLWRELDEVAEAIAEFDAILAEDGSRGAALFNRGMAVQAYGRYTESLQNFEAFLGLPDQDENYREDAQRMAALLREVLTEEEE
jgi:tetratricopeptide (TPR) repeat protein